MKRLFYAVLMPYILLATCFVIKAQAPVDSLKTPITEILNATEGVIIVQPDKLSERLLPVKIHEKTEEEIIAAHQRANRAWRVEIFSDNSRSAHNQATARRRNIQQRFPYYPTTLDYESPFWRVNVGAFSSRSDAEAAMAEIRKAFPAYASDLKIVRK